MLSVRVDRQSTTPIYLQITAQIRDAILRSVNSRPASG